RVHSRYMRLEAFDAEAANSLLDELAAEAHGVVAFGAAGQTTTETRTAYMRYVGQGHEIPVPLPNRPLASDDRDLLRREVERVYSEMFRRFIPAAAIEILTWTVSVSTPRVLPAPLERTSAGRVAAPSGRRPVFDPELGRMIDVPMYWRPDLVP